MMSNRYEQQVDRLVKNYTIMAMEKSGGNFSYELQAEFVELKIKILNALKGRIFHENEVTIIVSAQVAEVFGRLAQEINQRTAKIIQEKSVNNIRGEVIQMSDFRK